MSRSLMKRPCFSFTASQFRIVGKDALQRNGNVFLAEGEDGVALADAGSGGDDFIGKSLCGKLKIAFIQRESSAFFQSVERFRCISRINFDRVHFHVLRLSLESMDKSVSCPQQYNQHENSPCYGKSRQYGAQLVAHDGSVYFLYQVGHGWFLCAFIS